MITGRGGGKPRAAAEAVVEIAQANADARIALVGPDIDHVRDVMAYGPSGVICCSPPDFRPVYEPSKRQLTWPNGATATLFDSRRPDLLRRPKHSHAWAEDPRQWTAKVTRRNRGKTLRKRDARASWRRLSRNIRLGAKPRLIVTATPSPTRVIRDLAASPSTVVTRGATYDNAENLSKVFVDTLAAYYPGIRLSTG